MTFRRSLLSALGGASVPLLLMPAQADARQFTTAARPSEITLTPSGGNDSTQLQNAIDKLVTLGSGELVIGSGDWRFDQTVKLPRNESTGVRINVSGLGRPTFRGAADPLWRVEGMWGYGLSNLVFQGQGRRGTGLMLARESGNGTQGGQAVLSRVTAGDFNVGIQIGDPGGQVATSEIEFQGCGAWNCAYGFKADGYNALDFHFTMLSIGHNDYGVWTNTAGQIAIAGGSASHNSRADFHFGAGGAYAIRDFRSESTIRLYESGTNVAAKSVVIDGCNVEGPVAPDGLVIQGNWGDSLTLIGGNYAGAIGWAQVYGHVVYPGRLSMLGVTVPGPEPFVTKPDAENLLYSAVGCRTRYPDNVVKGQIPDQWGIVRGGKLVPTQIVQP